MTYQQLLESSKVLLGGRKKICFVATFDDSRGMLGTTDSEIYKKIRSAMMTIKTGKNGD